MITAVPRVRKRKQTKKFKPPVHVPKPPVKKTPEELEEIRLARIEWKKQNYNNQFRVKSNRDFGLLEDNDTPYNTARQFSLSGNGVSYEYMWETIQMDSRAMKKVQLK